MPIFMIFGGLVGLSLGGAAAAALHYIFNRGTDIFQKRSSLALCFLSASSFAALGSYGGHIVDQDYQKALNLQNEAKQNLNQTYCAAALNDQGVYELKLDVHNKPICQNLKNTP